MTCRALLLLAVLCWPALAFAAPPATVSVEAYRAQLQLAEDQLRQLEERAPRQLAPIVNALIADKIVKRADGATQTASGEEFRRLAKSLSPVATSRETRRLREQIALRRAALDEWSASTLVPADAQAIIAQLEGSGQIRTGPTWLEQTWSNFMKWAAQLGRDIMSWIGSLFPSATPGQLPSVDPAWIQAIFTLTVLALLAAIAFLVWRAVGGKIGVAKKRQGAFAFSEEDAELLLLPPDELRRRALEFAEKGNFREALRHLYISLLLNLDARGVWRYDARRTNWEHIAALKSSAGASTLVAPLADITRRFDRVRYGNAACGQNDWTQFERDVSTLEANAPKASAP